MKTYKELREEAVAKSPPKLVRETVHPFLKKVQKMGRQVIESMIRAMAPGKPEGAGGGRP